MSTSLGSVSWGSAPAIGIAFSYDAARSGTTMAYTINISVSPVSGGSYFGYPIYADITVENTLLYSGVVIKNASPSTWSSAITVSKSCTVSNKTSGTTPLKIRIYSGSGSSRDSTYNFSMAVSSTGSSGSSSGSGSSSSTSQGGVVSTALQNPAITVSTSLVNDNSVVDGWGVCVTGLSKISYSALVSVYGAAYFASGNMSIAGKQIGLANSGTITGSFLVTSNAGAYTTTGFVQDNNGRTGSYTGTAITVYDYKPPTISGASVYRCDASGTADASGAYIRAVATAGCSSVGSRNTVTLRARYKASGGSYGSYITMQSGTTTVLASSLSDDTNYEVELSVVDTVGTITAQTFRLSSGGVAFHLKEGGAGAAFGKKATADSKLAVGWDMSVDGDVDITGAFKVNGTSIFDLIYPVGSVYISTSENFDPATAFGGTWTRIDGKFLVGKSTTTGDTFATNGATGGGESSEFSVGWNNIPAHNHSLTITCNAAGGHSHKIGADYDGAYGSGDYTVHSGGYPGNSINPSTSSVDDHTHTVSITNNQQIGNTSATGPDKIQVAILPPYMVVNMWQRTA